MPQTVEVSTNKERKISLKVVRPNFFDTWDVRATATLGERAKRDDDNWEPHLVDYQMLHLKPLFHLTIQKRDQHQWNLDVTSDVVLSCCCCSFAGAEHCLLLYDFEGLTEVFDWISEWISSPKLWADFSFLNHMFVGFNKALARVDAWGVVLSERVCFCLLRARNSSTNPFWGPFFSLKPTARHFLR